MISMKVWQVWFEKIIQITVWLIVRFSRFFYRKKIVARPKKILIVKTHAIGDVLLVTPSIVALKKLFPETRFYALVGKWSCSALEDNPHIEELISYDDNILFNYRIWGILKLIFRIKKENFDWAFIFQPSILIQLLILLSGIPYRIGFDNRGGGGILNKSVPWKINDNRYVALNFLELTKSVGASVSSPHLEFYIPKEAERYAENFLKDYNDILRSGKVIIGLCPGGGVNPRDVVLAKLWPIDKYVKLIMQMIDTLDARFIVFGSHDDNPYVDRLFRYCGPYSDFLVNACLKTNLKQLGAMFKFCKMIITNDSATLHIAVALNIPSLSIFGPTNHYCLIPNDARHYAIQSNVECSPCYHNSPFPGCNRIQCMEEIIVDEVVEIATKHLQKNCN